MSVGGPRATGGVPTGEASAGPASAVEASVGEARELVVNADDFGMSPGVNRGVARGFEEGIVTSASLMVSRPAAEEAARYARRHPMLGVGLHIELGSWSRSGGEWIQDGGSIDTGSTAAVRHAVAEQLERFTGLMGRRPTHLDSHQHVHLEGPAREVVLELGLRLGVPVRALDPDVRYLGDFYGQDRHGRSYPDWVSPTGLIAVLESIEAGITELACHPGCDDDAPDDYRRERALELASLCDPAVARCIADLKIDLRSFARGYSSEKEHVLPTVC